MGLIIKENKTINTDNKDYLEDLREHLSIIRDENFNQYGKNSRLKHQAFSNVIYLLAEIIEEIKIKHVWSIYKGCII